MSGNNLAITCSKMADIDIEEHDVLDNPKIRTMFQNLAFLKSEPVDIDKDVPSDHSEAETEYQYYDTEPGTSEIKIASVSSRNINETNEYQTSNKIILGSKPCKVNSVPLGQNFSYKDTNTLNVISQDYTSIAENSDRFCSLCNTLCKTPYDLETHKQAVHSLLKVVRNVAVKRTAQSSLFKNTARKSTTPMTEQCDVCFQMFSSKTALHEHKNIVHDNSRKFCDHCEVYFPSGEELIKHLYTLLEKKFNCKICNVSFNSHQGLLNHNRTHQRKNTTKVVNKLKKNQIKTKSFVRGYQCCICYCIFQRKLNFMKHMSQHRVFNPELVPVVYDGKCKHCGILKSIHVVNKHILYTHPMAVKKKVGRAKKVATDRDSEVSNKPLKCFKCSKCNSEFSTRKQLTCHNIESHSKSTESDFKPEKITLKFEQILTDETKNDNQTINSNIKSVYKVSEAKLLDNPPVPNSILFKCNICAAHFMTCMKALSHKANCLKSTKGKKTCPKCGKIFPRAEFKLHKLQHHFTSKFKVYLTHKNMSARVVCLCPYCNLHFVEAKFWKHLLDGCSGNKKSDMCKICRLKFSPASFKEHCFSHKEKRLVREDFIIIDFFKQENTEVFQKEKQLKDKDLNTEGMLAPLENSIFAHGRYIHVRTEYYFCKLCSSYIGKTLKGKMCHMRSRDCKKSKRQFCETCGLTFQNKASIYHTPMHTIRQDLTVRNFTFFTFSDKKIIPPLPQFPTCVKCQCVILKTYGHECTSIKSIYCNICKKSFAQDAYKLHMDFHFVRGELEDSKVKSIPGPSKSSNKDEIPELLKKYEAFSTVWNILYLCDSCGIATDSYDNAVNHCQEHILQIFTPNDVRRCSNCNLKFEYKCMEKHKQYHSKTVNRDSFNIIKYDFNNMAESNWLLNSLSQEQAQQIVSRSIFKHTRFIRMKVLSGNSSDIILYKCFTCLKYINSIDVENHSRKSCDSSKKSYKCSMCKIDFDSKSNCDEHERLHIETQRHKFKIVAFNDEGDRKYDEILQEASHESQKRFRSEKEKAKINYTGSDDDFVDPMNVAIPKRYDYYQCSNCKLHIRNKFKYQFHRCYSLSMTTCHICGVNIPPQNMKLHIDHHERDPNFRRENYDIYEFDPASNVQTTVPVVESVETLYKCVCDVYFTSESRAQSHFDVCNTEQIPSEHCKTCGWMFYDKDLPDHIKLHHTEKKYEFIAVVKLSETKAKHKVNRCGYCSVVFSDKGRSKSLVHIKKCGLETSTIINGNKCNLCGLIFNRFSSLEHEELHEQYSNKDEVLTAEDFEISTIYHVNRRNPTKKDNKILADVYKCQACDSNVHFMTIKAVREHKDDDHEDTDTSVCAKCNLTFLSSELDEHINEHHIKLKCQRHNINVQKVYFDNEHDSTDNIVFRCKDCDVHFLDKDALECHFNSNHKIISAVVECRHCDLKFPTLSIYSHRQIHHNNNFALTDLHIETYEDNNGMIKVSKCLYEPTQVTLFRCSKNCEINFTNKKHLRYHFDRNHKTKSAVCQFCNLTFGPVVLPRHIEKYHENLGYTRKNFEIEVNDLINKKFVSISKITYDGSKDIITDIKERDDETDDEIDVSVNTTQYSDTSVSQKRPHSYSPTPSKIAKLTYHSRFAFDWLFVYRCNKCALYFNCSSVYNHHLAARCNVTDFITCNKCGLKFRDSSTSKHMAAHSMNVEDKKMHIINFNDTSVKWTHDEYNVTNLVYTKYTLFKCSKCNICYSLIDSLIDHCVKNHRSKKKFFCTYCDLVFNHHVSLSSHIKFYHNGEHQEENYHFVTDRDIKGVLDALSKLKEDEKKHYYNGDNESALNESDDVHVESNTDADDTLIEENRTIDDNDSIINNSNKTLNDRDRNVREKDDCVNKQDSVKTDVGNTSEKDRNIVDNVPKYNSVRLFKCASCEVFYITQSTCYKHALNHKPLNSEDFVKCKFCGLQFTCITLRKHIKRHHVTEFNLDHVIIEEYTPNKGGSPHVKIYNANSNSDQITTVSSTTVDTSAM